MGNITVIASVYCLIRVKARKMRHGKAFELFKAVLLLTMLPAKLLSGIITRL
jgi:uncharacterized paraquat-inducible protein A